MLKKGVMAIFIVVAISAIIIGAFAISNNKNSSNNIPSNQLTSLNTPLNNTSSDKNNVLPVNANNSMSNINNSVNNGKTFSNGKVDMEDTPIAGNINGVIFHNVNYHLSNITIISPAKAQKIAAQYIEQAGATPGIPDLVNQDGKKLYIVPVILNNTNVGEIDINAHDGSNVGGAGGVKN